MLRQISIRDLAVVQELDLPLPSGFIVLTGETGAGKSILLTALGLALGERADAGMIRSGATRAEVQLDVEMASAPPEVLQWLQDQELLDDDSCLLRRVVSLDGRSKAFINGRAVNLQTLQELAGRLVEIHGQHAHLKLIASSEQRRQLDAFGDHRDLLDTVNVHQRAWQDQTALLERLAQEYSSRTAREELLRYQIDELEQAGIELMDYEQLGEEHMRLANLGRIIELASAQFQQLYGDDHDSIHSRLARTSQDLQQLSQLAPEFLESLELIRGAQIQIKEAALEVRHNFERLEPDPGRLAWLEEKLAVFSQLARKHHVRPEELAQHLGLLRGELQSMEQASEQIDTVTAEREACAQRYFAAAVHLSAARQIAAERLAATVSESISELGMPQGRFQVDLNSAEDSAVPRLHGLEQIEFLVAANPGLPPRPIGKVASGGELSRLSLAIQVAIVHGRNTPTLIFDEVDSGIGGGVAEIVGKKLRALGHGRQVLSVTHLPQVAAQAHTHLLVEKTQGADSTTTRVRVLNDTERRNEIARMLGGLKITDQTLAHAEEMLALARAS